MFINVFSQQETSWRQKRSAMMSADDILSGGKSSRQISEEKVHVDHGLMRRLHLLDETFGDDFFYLSQSTVCMKCVYRDHRWLQQFCSSSVQSIGHVKICLEMSRHVQRCQTMSRDFQTCQTMSRVFQTCQDNMSWDVERVVQQLSLSSCTCPPTGAWSTSPG